MKVKNCLFSAIFFCVVGCAEKANEVVGSGAVEHPCDPAITDEDPWNCGGCTTPEENHVCNVDKTDFLCVDGDCVCGDGPPCDEREELVSQDIIADCRFGQCMRSDPNGISCEFDEECGIRSGCLEGRCSSLDCKGEICDGADNDCDGEIDEVAPEAPLNESCFNGRAGFDVGDVLPPCRPGMRVCHEGVWSECLFEIPPLSEGQGLFACDGIDNDCDGCIDGLVWGSGCRDITAWGFDIVFVIDISGSMQGVISAVRDAVHNFAARYSRNEEFKFGIIVLASGQYRYPESPYLYLDLSDFDLFETQLASLDTDGGGFEPQWDAVYELGTGELPMNWRPDSTRIIILFSDEEGQTYRYLFGLSTVDEHDMCAALTHGEVLAVAESPLYFSQFDDCAAYIFSISNDAEIMADNLQSVISDPCE